MRSAARRRRGGDTRGPGAPAAAAGVVVLAAAAALAVVELRADLDWTDVLMVLPMITVLGLVAVVAAGVMIQARWSVLGALCALLGLAGYFVLTSTVMSALLGSVFGEYPRAPDCTAASCAWGAARGWTGGWLGVALVVLAWLVGRLTLRTRHEPPAVRASAQPAAALPAEGAPSSDDPNATAYEAVRDLRKR